jgi:hypothetical protein
MNLEHIRNALIDRLSVLCRQDGVWGYTRAQAAVEPTCLVALAVPLSLAGRQHLARRILSWQREDGSWPVLPQGEPTGSWTTSIALLALLRLEGNPAGITSGVRWLLDHRGLEKHWLWQWKFRFTDTRVRFDPRKFGWGWVSENVSWVIPTSFGILALQRAKQSGLATGAAVDERVRVGLEMLRDRACPGGGWNAGNGSVFHVSLRPNIEATALALLAAQTAPVSLIEERALSWLAVESERCPSAYSLAWAALAFRALPDHGDAASQLKDRLASLIQPQRISTLDTITAAVCVLALRADAAHPLL